MTYEESQAKPACRQAGAALPMHSIGKRNALRIRYSSYNLPPALLDTSLSKRIIETIMPKIRDDKFLQLLLVQIWSRYFSDIPISNTIHIQFGRIAKKRLGSIRRYNIRKNRFDTLILINGHFKNPKIPKYVIVATIAHELCHYSQGFSSPLPQLSDFPHRGGQVYQEMQRRELLKFAKKENIWLQLNWLKFLRDG